MTITQDGAGSVTIRGTEDGETIAVTVDGTDVTCGTETKHNVTDLFVDALSGNDTVTIEGVADSIGVDVDGGPGSNTIDARGSVLLYFAASSVGDDEYSVATIYGSDSSPNTLTGDEGPDYLLGGMENDVLYGLGGNDYLDVGRDLNYLRHNVAYGQGGDD